MGLSDFNQFVKTKNKVEQTNRDVWVYTRVSTKDQQANKSLQSQKDEGLRYAKEHNYNITRYFGGTYESASGDFTRKEFTKLISEVKASRKRPLAIMIFTINRFSRTGGGGVSLANELVETLNTNLIEISSGKNTLTEEGKLEIYRGLIKARQENLDRLKVTIPGLKKHLEEGGWLGNVPKGYVQFGKRVRAASRYSEKQIIKINEEGLILKKAWKWKLDGDRDCEILKRLEELGLKMTKQALSEMWRNPFYCGINVHGMLDKPVKGNWEKLVSEQDFMYVLEILKGNKFGYTHSNSDYRRPLTAFIRCHKCNGKMAGYEVKNKGKHYYKCQKCLKVSINTETTVRGVGANNLFKDLLTSYQLSPDLAEAFKEQLKLTYSTLNEESEDETAILEKQLAKEEADFKKLKRKYALEDNIDGDIYTELCNDFEAKIDNLKHKINNASKKISNLDNYINISTEIAQNISKYWLSEDLETSIRLQELVFPEGIVIDSENRQYLTPKCNQLFSSNAVISMISEGVKKNGTDKKSMPSCVVARSRLELPTFGL